MASMKIYTKTGDEGETSLYNGERALKSETVFEALGMVDTLNSSIGLARHYCTDIDFKTAEQLEYIQSRLLDVGSAIATPLDNSSKTKLNRVSFPLESTPFLERCIDEMDLELPPLTQFILPSGGLASSHLHMSRTFCRTAERNVVSLVKGGKVDKSVLIFLNRLSDYLFTAARYMAKKSNFPEKTYKKA